MAYIFVGALVLLGLAAIINWAANADPGTLRSFVRYLGAILMVALALLMIARAGPVGVGLAGPLVLAAFMLATGKRLPGFGGGSRTAGQNSQVETSHLRVTLDHDSGDMDGDILDGQFLGRRLSDLTRDELSDLYDELLRDDPDGARLLDAYLGRRFQGEWEEQPQDEGPTARSSAPMTREEALEVLGLQDGASASDIKAAHRRLMKKFHPDQGGSTYFAARINQAKDLLLG